MSQPPNSLGLRELLDRVPRLTDLKWGLRVNPEFPRRQQLVSLLPFDSTVLQQVEHYNQVLVPADDQRLNCCDLCATTKLIEGAIWTFQKRMVQLRYEEAYWAARRRFYDDDKDEGLLLHQGPMMCRELGMIPPDTPIKRFPVSRAGIMQAIEGGLFMIGQSVHDGFRPRNLEQGNFSVNEAMAAGLKWGENGHAMAVCATNWLNGTCSLGLLQSWGKQGVDGSGVIFESVDHYLQLALDEALAYAWTEAMRTWTGFEKYIEKEYT